MSVSSINQGSLYSSSPYQADKELLSNMTDKLNKSIDSKDFSSAKDILESMQKFLENKTSKRLNSELSQIKQEFDNLDKAIENKDSKSAKEATTTIKDSLKNNKNLILKTHSMDEIRSQLTGSFMTALYG